jgi:mRNA-degrading endonuclease RelE of RelBE toxin-antitoxin system
MNWIVGFSSSSLKFLKKNNLSEDLIIEKIKLALRRFKGEQINIDIKKLGGKWEEFYRIRVGEMRIILDFQFRNYKVFVEEIDWRGGLYK